MKQGHGLRYQRRGTVFHRVAFLLFAAIGTLCGFAGDIPQEFVVAGSDVHKGEDYQARQAGVAGLQGVWHFGDSESEWSVAIIPHGGGMIVQTSSVIFSNESRNFRSVYSTVNRPKFENGVFKIAKPHREGGYYNAMFIEPKTANPKTGRNPAMLLLDGNSMDSGKGASQEAGVFSLTLREWFGDQYAISCTILGEDELNARSTAELALMRNGIYARYGMIFANPVLKMHFSKQEWYRPWQTDVTDCISDLEWSNIRSIRKGELQRTRKR